MKTKINKPFCFTLEDPIFSGYILFVAGEVDTSKEYIVKKYKPNNSSVLDAYITHALCGCFFSLEDPCGAEISILWFNEEFGRIDISNYRHLSVLIHEIFHTISRILRVDGINHINETEEVYAYFQSWLFKSIYQRLSERK